jgi:hypothetical protein
MGKPASAPLGKSAIIASVVVGVLFTGTMFWMAFDALADTDEKIFFLAAGGLFSIFVVIGFWRLFSKNLFGIFVGIGATTLIFVGAVMGNQTVYGKPDVLIAETAMAEQRKIAIACLEKNAELRVKYLSTYGLGFNDGEPWAGPTCYQEPSWEILPSGWRYEVVEDTNVSDGTFSFSARSRDGKRIVCTESACATKQN